jgi:septal ring factor EnvC (AmiA/AmiB activator)
MSIVPSPTLSGAILARAEAIRTMANLLADVLPDASRYLTSQAAALGLLHMHADALERQLSAARRTIAEIHAQAAEDADAAEAAARAADPERAARWQRHARIIAAMLPPIARREP